MELLVIRHAIAAPGSMHLPDAERPLTPEGRARFTQVIQGLQHLKIHLDQLYHSPWRRAVETAELLTPLLEGAAVSHAGLARPPGLELLETIGGERVAVVGHQPWMGELVAWLTMGTLVDGSLFAFKRGGVAWLEGRP
ncbi:MAG: phosphohistidine phosphatase, partial [Candidatus Tectomicrobia bacterium]|nr:phosphohistidine phosphatase [Candidatus Tectomicrobia bacterium]